MEYEVVRAEVPKGLVKEGMQLVIGVPRQAHLLIGNVYYPGFGTCSVCLIHKPLKPDWNPPKMKKGWLTWDDSEWWWWWPVKPQYDQKLRWAYPEIVGSDSHLREIRIGEIADLLGFPDCTGFDERNCIWEIAG